MKVEFKIPHGTGVAVWYDNELVAVVVHPTKEKIEQAVTDHNCFASSEIVRPLTFDTNQMVQAHALFKLDRHGFIFEKSVILTCVTLY